MAQANRLAGSCVIVTGATGGIGSAVARRLAREGVRVCAVDLDPVRLDDLVASLDSGGAGEGDSGGHVAVPADLTDLEGHSRIVEAALGTGGPLLGLAHLAAVLRRRASIDEVTEDDWDAQIDTNLKATFFFDRTVAQALVRQGSGGAIVNFSSQGWWTGGFGGSVVYAASKGGIVSMSRGLARTLAPHGIRVNTVAPGFVDTEMMISGMSDEQLQESASQVPLGRFATPEEVGDTVAFLLGPDARYITGATLNVTGGQIMY